MDRRHDDSALATMHPAYFAMVMATGVLSVATAPDLRILSDDR